jgi:hypothetical protein
VAGIRPKSSPPFAATLVFEIQGDDGVLPWIGRSTDRQVIADFFRDIRAVTAPVTFDVEDILASDSRSAIIGELRTRIKATGKIIAMRFAIVLTITGDDALPDVGGQLRRLQGGPHLIMALSQQTGGSN